MAEDYTKKRRSLIEVATENEFGVDLDSLSEDSPLDKRPHRDVTYVPGYSDLRHQRDCEIAEVVHGSRPAGSVTKMPVYMRWVRGFSAKKQETDGTKLFAAEMNGLRPVRAEDVGNEWLTAMPPGSRILPDGSIAQGDTILMVATAEAAARNQRRKRLEVEAQLASIGSEIVSAAQAANSEATVEKALGKPISKGRVQRGS